VCLNNFDPCLEISEYCLGIPKSSGLCATVSIFCSTLLLPIPQINPYSRVNCRLTAFVAGTFFFPLMALLFFKTILFPSTERKLVKTGSSSPALSKFRSFFYFLSSMNFTHTHTHTLSLSLSLFLVSSGRVEANATFSTYHYRKATALPGH
jgi:hypothetical protein